MLQNLANFQVIQRGDDRILDGVFLEQRRIIFPQQIHTLNCTIR